MPAMRDRNHRHRQHRTRLAVMESDRLGIGYGPWGPPVNNRRVNGH